MEDQVHTCVSLVALAPLCNDAVNYDRRYQGTLMTMIRPLPFV